MCQTRWPEARYPLQHPDAQTVKAGAVSTGLDDAARSSSARKNQAARQIIVAAYERACAELKLTDKPEQMNRYAEEALQTRGDRR
jgi:hypothetical protein